MPASLAGALVPLTLMQGLFPNVMVMAADFERPSTFAQSTAVSYAPDLIPYGARVQVKVVKAVGQTSVGVLVTGVAADHAFPAHVHTGRCGTDPASAGPHYQDKVDPMQPSTDPAYANDLNEVRLAVRTDEHGAGETKATVPWTFRAGEAHSVVLHAGSPAGAHTATDRVACVNFTF